MFLLLFYRMPVAPGAAGLFSPGHFSVPGGAVEEKLLSSWESLTPLSPLPASFPPPPPRPLPLPPSPSPLLPQGKCCSRPTPAPAGLGILGPPPWVEGSPGRPSYQALRPWLPAAGLVRSRKRRLGEQIRVFGMLEPLNAFHMAAGAGQPGPTRGLREEDGLCQPAAPPLGPGRPLPLGRHIYLCFPHLRVQGC